MGNVPRYWFAPRLAKSGRLAFRRLVIESLERRQLLTGTSEAYNAPSADWFGVVESPPRLLGSGAGVQPLSRFVVRLDEDFSAAISHARDSWQVFYAPTALPADVAPPWVQFRAIAGLGLPGQILVESHASPSEAAGSLSRLPHIASFEPERSVSGASENPPDDPLYSQQEGLLQIDASEAFGLLLGDDLQNPRPVGSRSVVIAEIDSGIDATHPDLFQNIWLNNGEIPAEIYSGLFDKDFDGLISLVDLNATENAALVTNSNTNQFIDAEDILSDPRWNNQNDEDQNGFFDDLFGWDFVNNDNNPADDNGHGTHVAGILGAIGDNGIGVAGLNWVASILPLKFLDQNNRGSNASAIAAFNYTTLMKERYTATVDSRLPGEPLQGANVQVSNNSWGLGGGLDAALQSAVGRAGDANILVVAAAGNGNALGQGIDNDTNPFYPASFAGDWIISVAASDADDNLARNSNFGRTSVDIAAPGIGIKSTIPGTNDTNQYGFDSGTSMAAPFVSGVAALIYSQHPDATPQEVRDAILKGVDKTDSLQPKFSSGGRLNARGALLAETFAPRVTLASKSDISSSSPSSSNDVILSVQYTDNDAIRASSIDSSDISIRRIGYSNRNVVVTLRDPAPTIDASALTVAYRVRPSDGLWDALDQGIYEIVVSTGHVFDRQGTAAPSIVIGTFSVAVVDPLVIVVDSFFDTVDVNPGNGVVADSQGRHTLRAAIQEINARPPANYTIALRDGNYALSIPGRIEDSAATGDLDILKRLKIVGTGASTTTIDAQSLDRVFDVVAGADLTLSLLTITGGLTSAATGDRDGGGIQNRGILKLEKMDVVGNTANSSGGGLVNEASGNAAIEDTDLLHNATQDPQGNGGGGIRNAGILTLRRSTLAFNVTPAGLLGTGGGGGLSNINANVGQVTLENSTFSNNRALNGSGGGIINQGKMTIESCTITENRADVGTAGGIMEVSGNGVAIGNSIVADNVAAIVPDGFGLPYSLPDVRGFFKSTGFNLIGVTTQLACCESLEGFTSGRPPGSFPDTPTLNDRIGFQFKPLTAALGPLTENGGFTLTHDPLDGSPAIDLGGGFVSFSGTHDAAPSIDQRGIPRRFILPTGRPSTVDTGAVERFHGRVRGVQYLDRNGNAKRDTDEPGLSGWTIYVDINENLTFDPGEPHAISQQDNPLTPTLNESGSYELSGITPGNYLLRFVSQDGFEHSSPLSIRRNPSMDFLSLADKTTPIPDQPGQFFGSLSQVVFDDGMLTFSDEGQRRVYQSDGLSAAALLVAPGAVATNGAVLEQIIAHQQDGENIAILARPAGKTVPELFIRQAGGEISPIANPNPAIAIPAQTDPSRLFAISAGIVLFVNGGQLFASSPNGVVSASTRSGIEDPRLDAERGFYSFESGGNMYINGNQITGLTIGRSFAAIGTHALDRGEVVFTAGDSGGLQGLYVGSSPDSVRPLPVDTNTFVPGSTTVKFKNLVPATSQPTFFPNVAIEDGTVVFAAEDTSGNFGLYAVVAEQVIKIITINDSLGGRDIVNLRFEPNNALRGNKLAFQAEFSDGTDAVYGVEFASVQGHRVQVFPTQSIDSLDFGVTANPAEFHGVKFEDLDRDAVKDPDEPGLPGWTIYIDANRNGALDSAEPFTVTDDAGSFAFFDVAALQTYIIAEVTQAGWEQTAPLGNGGKWIVSPVAGQIVTGVDFGNVRSGGGQGNSAAKLQGRVFIDANANGQMDVGESPKSSITVFLDQNGNGQRETTELKTTTDPSGQYGFAGLTAGNYQVRLELDPLVTQTSPSLANAFDRGEFQLGKNPQGVAAADFDGVKGPDLAVTIADKNLVTILLNDGAAGFTTVQSLTTHNQPGNVAAGDLTGDGRPDLVVSNAYGNDISIFVNQKNPLAPFQVTTTLHYPTQLTAPAQGVPLGITLGNLNADSLLDIAVVNSFSDEVAIFLNETVVLPNGQANVKFRLAQIVANVGKRPQAIVAGNFTDDAKLDLAVANFGDSVAGHTVRILKGDGLGGFTLFGNPWIVGSGPTSISTAHLNSDGFLDLVTSNFSANTVTVLWGTSNGAFPMSSTYAAGFGPSSVATTDIDGDLDIDLVVSNGAKSTDENHVVLLRNQGGAFAAAEPSGSAFIAPGAAFSVVAADFRNDGDESDDLALVNPFPLSGAGNEGGRVTVLKNTVVANRSRRAIVAGSDVTGLDFGIQVAGPFAWHNAPFPVDTDDDGFVVADDALTIINALNADLFDALPPINNSQPKVFYDVVADNFLAPDDALAVINHLNAFGPSGEGEAIETNVVVNSRPQATQSRLQLEMEELLSLLESDVALQSKPRRPTAT